MCLNFAVNLDFAGNVPEFCMDLARNVLCMEAWRRCYAMTVKDGFPLVQSHVRIVVVPDLNRSHHQRAQNPIGSTPTDASSPT